VRDRYSERRFHLRYIVLIRNPSNKALDVIMAADEDRIVEFETEDAAEQWAAESKICRAWGYQVVQVWADV
jgi:hypothetical protein